MHYLEKLKISDQELDDPFAIDEEQWSKDLTKWPELEFGNLYTYLIKSKGVYTAESLCPYKSLKAYNCCMYELFTIMMLDRDGVF